MSAAASWRTLRPRPNTRRRWIRLRACCVPSRCKRMSEWADWVWLNGRLVRGADAAVSVFDRSFLMGDGLFETMRSVQGRLFRLDRHLARLQRGAALLRLSLRWNATELTEAIR